MVDLGLPPDCITPASKLWPCDSQNHLGYHSLLLEMPTFSFSKDLMNPDISQILLSAVDTFMGTWIQGDIWPYKGENVPGFLVLYIHLHAVTFECLLLPLKRFVSFVSVCGYHQCYFNHTASFSNKYLLSIWIPLIMPNRGLCLTCLLK